MTGVQTCALPIFLEDLAAKHLIDAVAQVGDRRYVQQLRVSMRELEALIGMREAIVRHQGGDVSELSLLSAQELLARRDVVEEVAHGDSGARSPRHLVAREDLATGDLNARSDCLIVRAGFKKQSGNAGDAWQCLAAKAECRDGIEVFDVRKLTGSVAFKGKQRVVAEHAAAVIGNADEAASSGFDLQQKFFGTRVERIFEELFHDRGWPFDNFASGDFVGDIVREDAYAAQEVIVAGASPVAQRLYSRIYFSIRPRSSMESNPTPTEGFHVPFPALRRNHSPFSVNFPLSLGGGHDWQLSPHAHR